MRGLTAILLTLIVLGAGAPLAGAVAECLPACLVTAALPGFAPPAVVVASGAALTWQGLDPLPHTATAEDGCFNAYIPSRGASREVRFTLLDGVVYASSPGVAADACEGARVVDGLVRIPYVCAYHPNMVGEVGVRA